MRTTVILMLALGCACPAAEKFVLVRGGPMPGSDTVRLDDFEMADAPVTNAEWAEFVKAAKHRAPPHWVAGAPPPGMENHPVIYVNRYDVVAYLQWRSAKEKRIYRLPTQSEYEYASRAGSAKAMYPWGDAPPEGKANFDGGEGREFSNWKKYLKPVRSYEANALGLYDLAGNVWQMVSTDYDPAARQYVYRLTHLYEKESSVAGGSWARTAPYLRIRAGGGASAGIRHPDLGFRLVREPAGSTHFRRVPRRVVALGNGSGSVYIGWQLLAEDAESAGFHVYRSGRRDAAGVRITREPVRGSTNFVDTQPGARTSVYYRVRAVASNGGEGPPSGWAGPPSMTEAQTWAAAFEPTTPRGGYIPIFGDLDGDGVLDAAVRLDNGIREMSRDPGVPVELEAFTSYGRQLWRRPLVDHGHCYGNANNVPVVVFDMDNDGRAEVIARVQEGDTVFLALLDGMTGRVVRKTPWRAMATDHSGTSTRIHMAVAYLDGKRPSIITQTGLYENEIFDAFDASLNRLWTYRSEGATSGSGSHHIDIADVDDDGRDEVFDGTTLLSPMGVLKWSIYRLHPDIVAIKHFLPGAKQRQVYYAVESGTHAGAYLVEAATGKILWKVNREIDPRWTHAHVGWASDIDASSAGLEMLTNRDGHEAKDTVLLASDGRILANPMVGSWRPVNWTGGAVRELLASDGRTIGRWSGREVTPIAGASPVPAGCRVLMTADLAGDYRDEIVAACQAAGSGAAIRVFTNASATERREVTRTSSREYRLWMARNIGGGYGSYFEWQPGH